MAVKFEDFRIQVKGKITDNVKAALEECAGEVEAQTKRNSRMGSPDTPTKNSFKHRVDEKSEMIIASIGSDDQNAIWEEFGTGEYALEGNGRLGAWYVPVEKVTGYKKPSFKGQVIIVHGKNGQKFYKTDGKRPSRAFWKAFTMLKNPIIKRLENSLKGL